MWEETSEQWHLGTGIWEDSGTTRDQFESWSVGKVQLKKVAPRCSRIVVSDIGRIWFASQNG